MSAGRIPTTANSPLTVKGDLFTFSTGSAKLAVGANDTALVADSAQATGLAYKTKGVFNGLTTTGDTIYSSSGTTQSRLGIGSTGQVLTVASGVPSWATPAGGGGMTLLSTTTLSGVTTTISSIDQTYIRLIIYIFGVTNGTGNSYTTIEPNASSSLVDYFQTATTTTVTTGNALPIYPWGDYYSLYTDATNAATLTIDNYASTTARKTFSLNALLLDSASSRRAIMISGGINTTSAISSLVFRKAASYSFNAGTVLIYGVK